MIDKTLLKQILLDNRKEIESYKIVHRDIVTEGFNCYVFVGVNAILECHIEMTGKDNPMLFLDEIHNISRWEKFARRMADNKKTIWITGSNAKMLS